MRPIWQVTTRQPYVVPHLRKSLEKQGWGVYSGDIPFLNRLFLDLDLEHIHAKGEIIDTIDAPNNDMQQTTKVRAAGGAGRYSVDITVACTIDDLSIQMLSSTVQGILLRFRDQYVDESVLCAAAWIEDMGTGVRQKYALEAKKAIFWSN